jgi:hypothetical protein
VGRAHSLIDSVLQQLKEVGRELTEAFVGSIWVYCKGDFDGFVQMLYEVWLEEFLHMVYRWERFSSQDFQLNPALIDEEKPVKEWVRLLNRHHPPTPHPHL